MRWLSAPLAILVVVLPSCKQPHRSSSSPAARDSAQLSFNDMPDDGRVDCLEGCEGRDLQWLDPHTLRISPVPGPTSILLHYRAEGVDARVRITIIPVDLELRFPKAHQSP